MTTGSLLGSRTGCGRALSSAFRQWPTDGAIRSSSSLAADHIDAFRMLPPARFNASGAGSGRSKIIGRPARDALRGSPGHISHGRLDRDHGCLGPIDLLATWVKGIACGKASARSALGLEYLFHAGLPQGQRRSSRRILLRRDHCLAVNLTCRRIETFCCAASIVSRYRPGLRFATGTSRRVPADLSFANRSAASQSWRSISQTPVESITVTANPTGERAVSPVDTAANTHSPDRPSESPLGTSE